ncbi:TonB-dependent receptor [Draconibacterium sp. IB214405]|uniref:SusC/RagA family TonB-linked outer membrane protein n=1 Tax=Draconibacterium sp. IB214405 TaxID=3097352 RepID=UPI002A15AFD3|nr:TonB-dependent receptor [Draconibacterium sp. IB214405]MDX8337751.1 TonB-dependent receptor [Draconibacterium sp. IB214405]
MNLKRILWPCHGHKVKKYVRIMKLTWFLVLVFTLQTNASLWSQTTKMDVNVQNTTLLELFTHIEKNSEYRFFYSNDEVDVNQRVTLHAEDEVIGDILKSAFVDLPYSFKELQSNMILVELKEEPAQSGAQQNGVRGSVKDEAGLPLPGVTVIVKGTTNGTVTDIDGNFSLTGVDQGTVLQISFVGMRTVELEVGDKTVFDVTMTEENIGIDEVIAIGYGSQSKRNITGAVQNLSTDEIADIPTAQLSQKLQGKLAGVQINQTSGIPGQGMSIRIRGQASISAGSDPLYVVDGFPITGDISNINPDEIESISVLKDASSTALYGSRAANGVVMITTKQAKFGESKVDVNVYQGLQQIPEYLLPEMMNAREFAQFKKEINEENGWGVPEMFQNPEQYGEGTDWLDAITRTALIQNYSIQYSASKDKFKSSVVGGFFSQEGVLLNSKFNRFSLRANSEYQFNDRIKVGVNLSNTVTHNKTPSSDGVWYETGGILQGALLTSPLAPYINEDGTIPINAGEWGNDYGSMPGPNWYNQVQVVKNTAKNIGVLANAFVEIDLWKGLKYKSSVGVDLGSNVADSFTPSTAGGIFNPGNATDFSRISGSHSNSFGYSWLWENILTYKKSFDDHNFDVLAGYSSQSAHGESGVMYGSSYPDNNIETLNVAKTITGTTDRQDWSLLSLISRVNYNYKQRYLVSLAYRRDGSSKFGSDNRWGDFPSASLGWVASEEEFMSVVPKMSFLKLRASYGVTGNNNIGNYTQYASMVATNSPMNNVLVSGKSLDGLNNTELGWENTSEFDVGFDIGFFNNRVYLIYDYFHRNTDNLLYTVDIPISSGFYNFTTNIGELEFWGHEFTVNTKNLTGEFKWSTDFNISFNRNKALKLGTSNAAIYGENTITEVGQPIGQLYALKWEGLYYTQEEIDEVGRDGAQVGTVKFADKDGDGWVNNDDRDKYVLGSSAPKATYGITNTFNYKNFDLSIVGQGAYGHKIFNHIERFSTNLDGAFNVLEAVSRRWRSPEDPGDGIYGKVISGTTGYERDWMSSKFLYDASYFAIKNITLGYQVPFKNSGIVKGLRVYGSIQQAYVFTKYPGNNPEVSAAGGLYAGNDKTAYPVPRTFTLGLNLNL